MPLPVVTRDQVVAPDALERRPGRPHVCVLVSLNFPDLTEPVAQLVRRFTRNALTALTCGGASYSLVDSSVPDERADAATAGVVSDALLVLGGGDIAAACYGAVDRPVPNSYGVDEAADRMSLALIGAHLDAGVPVLGICRGAQLLNVAYGGTIVPDLTDHRLHHGGPGEPMFLDEKIEVVGGSRLAAILGAGPVVVRSGHHQAVHRVGDGLIVSALALDGVVEAIEDPARWVIGVQFHPEDDLGGDRELSLLTTALLDATRHHREVPTDVVAHPEAHARHRGSRPAVGETA